MRDTKGITLISLIITIIVLLILAGITISQLTKNGLFEQSKQAKEKYDNSKKLENDTILEYEKEVEKHINGDRSIIDDNILWEGRIEGTGETATLKDSIENYKYLLLQTEWAATGAAIDNIMDVRTIKEKGYFEGLINSTNAHVFICMYNAVHKYMAFTSDRSLIITYSSGAGAFSLTKIIGVK